MVMQPYAGRSHSDVRYGNALQYALILSKGKPRHINLLRDRLNKHAGRTTNFVQRHANGEVEQQHSYTAPKFGVRGPIWYYPTGANVAEEKYTNLHPARMAESIARDHILSWSRPGDLIFDPMCGVGTTAKMAYLNDRHYLGMEIYGPYWVQALRRLRDVRKRQKAIS
jgi:site-specific DNA-methyltransferase (adenine-specific)